jgi:hypothetical protein
MSGIKNRYKIKKQWGSIIPKLSVPNDIPFNYTKNFRIVLTNGEERIVKNKKDFDQYIKQLIEDETEIENISIELDYDRLITNVEKKFNTLLKI